MTRPITTAGMLALVLLPLVISASFHLHVLITVFLFATLAQAWNLLGGYAGQLSFGHSVFFGLGAYTTAVLLSRYAILPWIGAPAGAI
ncbi:MAG TPA: branched-chain amino acid ABC transporter ATP-binding protein, partial [bacterium]|nr:branched-chain amino acid ABC transporter ATP-binding protein [bacterium]